MLWIHRWIGDRVQAHLPSLRSASDCFELVAIWSRSREAAEALRGDRQDGHVQILYGEDTLRGMEIDPVGGGSDKRSVWGYAYSVHIPYEMGSQLELLRVSQPSSSNSWCFPWVGRIFEGSWVFLLTYLLMLLGGVTCKS